jgi:hypothetical protein
VGPRLLCFAAGAALSAFYLHLGLLATPFFGSGTFLWASAFASFLLAVALGLGAGDAIAALAGRREAALAAPRLACAGGLLAWLAVYLLPLACRAILDRDPEWTLAPAAAFMVLSLVPGALLAGVGPSVQRTRLEAEEDPRRAVRESLRLQGLMALGGIAGVAACSKALLRADEVVAWFQAYAAGGLLALLSLAYMGPRGRVAGGAAVLGLAAVCAVAPSELQRERFKVALELAWRRAQGGSVYYRVTAIGGSDLSAEELQEVAASVNKVSGSSQSGVIVACMLLERLGAVTVSGEGLTRSLELLLPPDARPFVIPIFETFESVRSDGAGTLTVTIKRKPGEEGARCRIPGSEPGQGVDFLFKGDFTLKVSHVENVWRIDVGPQLVTEAGLFDVYDRHRSPVLLPNAVLWVDACLLGLILEDYPEQVVIKATAQGSIGAVQTIEVKALAK